VSHRRESILVPIVHVDSDESYGWQRSIVQAANCHCGDSLQRAAVQEDRSSLLLGNLCDSHSHLEVHRLGKVWYAGSGPRTKQRKRACALAYLLSALKAGQRPQMPEDCEVLQFVSPSEENLVNHYEVKRLQETNENLAAEMERLQKQNADSASEIKKLRGDDAAVRGESARLSGEVEALTEQLRGHQALSYEVGALTEKLRGHQALAADDLRRSAVLLCAWDRSHYRSLDERLATTWDLYAGENITSFDELDYVFMGNWHVASSSQRLSENRINKNS